jgi:transposase
VGTGGDRLGLGASAFWGAHTGPNPTDRAKNGCKRHVITDANGVPLVVSTTPANVRDEQPAIELLKSIPPIRQPRGRPRRKPDALMGDRGYGFPSVIAAGVAMNIISLLAPRGSEHGSGLGKQRYVVERTLSWFGNYRRIKFCYEKTGVSFQAFHDLAATLICFGIANRSGDT